MPDPEAALTNPETVYAFVDTNTLIHFPFVNQIDWPKELGAKEVCLVFCFIVFEELDKIKDGMTKPGRRELARRVGKFLGELLGPAPLDTPVDLPQRPNTTIMYASKDDLAIEPRLKSEKQDDHLLAALLHFQNDHPQAQVLLVADDFNLRQRAKLFGASARALPESMKRPLPRTEDEERLRRLEAQEPQVEVEFGAEGADLHLPYHERRTRLTDLAESYDAQVRAAFADIDREFIRVRGVHPEFQHPEGPPPFRPLREENLSGYKDENRFVVAAARDLELGLLTGHLEPETRIKQYPGGHPSPQERPQYERWQADVARFRELAKEREGALFYAAQDLEYYELSLVIKHVGGLGIQEGSITVTVEEPLAFRLTTFLSRVDWDKPLSPFRSEWSSKPDTPSSTEGTPHKQILKFGSLNPTAAFRCDPIYIYAKSVQNLVDGSKLLRLKVEVGGFNIKVPYCKTFTIRFG